METVNKIEHKPENRTLIVTTSRMVEDVDEYTAPDGFEFTGEYRQAKPGEWFFGSLWTATISERVTLFNFPILKKIS